MFKHRAQRIALVASVLFHLLILAIYRPLAQIHIFPNQDEAEISQAMEPIEFELVETPDDAIQQRPESSKLVSDKNAIGRDEYQDKDKPIGEAYSEGQTQYRIFAGQLEPAGMVQPPPQEPPTEESQETLQDQDQNYYIDESIDYSGSRQRKNSHKKFNKNLLAQSSQGRSSMQRQFTDDVNYDQRHFSADALGGVSLSTYAWDFAPYILHMKKKLKENIYPPPAFMQMGAISGETVLRFKVMPDGSATDITLVGYKGHSSLMETSMQAVKNATPFRPLPRNFPEEYLELTWTFIYSINR